MLSILERVLAPIGPTGGETPVAEVIRELAGGCADSARTDVMGNLILTKKGKDGGKRILFSAHMDHIGFIVTDIEKEGYLRVMPLGGIGLNVSLTRHVRFQNGVDGVLAAQPVLPGDKLAMKHMFIDIGASSREEALQRVQIGDSAVYAPDFFLLGEHRVASPAMDDRCACALLVKLLTELDQPENTVIALFSTQEEVGLRGAGTAAFTEKPDMAVALDVTLWGDTPEVKDPPMLLGHGPAVKIMDRCSISSPVVRDALFAAAEKAGVNAQREVLAHGGTDAGGMQQSRGGLAVGTLSIPCRYVHSACEVIDMRDMEGALKLLKVFVNEKY